MKYLTYILGLKNYLIRYYLLIFILVVDKLTKYTLIIS